MAGVIATTGWCIIIRQRLEEDLELNQRTSLSIDDIISLLEFCITSTYFSFQGKFYEQVEGAAMGSPLSPIVANIYMETFEVETISSAPSPPKFWKRYVDDTFTILESSKKEEFLIHLNSIDQQYSSHQKSQEKMGPCHSWTFWCHLVEMGASAHLFTGSPLTQISICSGRVIIPCHLNTV